MPETLPRSVRISSDIWNAAVTKAHEEDTTLTNVVRIALLEFLGRADITAPPSSQSESRRD